MRETGPAAPAGELALLERAIAYTLGNLNEVSAEALGRPTPCREWDLRALLQHLDDSLAALQEASDLAHVSLGPVPLGPVPGGPVPLGPVPGGPVPGGADVTRDGAAANLLSTLRARACRLLGGWVMAGAVPRQAVGAGTAWAMASVAVGGVPAPTGLVARAGTVEIAVHGWDVGQACGHGRPIPAELAEEMLLLVPSIVTDDDRPGRFAEPVPVAAGASPGDRLVACLGRRPG